MDKTSASVHRFSSLDRSYQAAFECSIAIRWLRFVIDTDVDLSSPSEESSYSDPPEFFSSSGWLKDVCRPVNSSKIGSRIRIIDVSGFEPERFLGQRIVRSNRAGMHVVLKDYSLHLAKTIPESSEIVIILVANVTVKGIPHRPLVVSLVVDFHRSKTPHRHCLIKAV